MTETTIENYQERALRTLALLGSNAIDGSHMALGITTETEELKDALEAQDLINAREEHGDTNWYIANECNIYGLSFVDLYRRALSEPHKSTFKLHNIVDLHKREFAYGKEMNVDSLKTELINLIKYLIWVGRYYGFEYEGSLQINIAKLYKRYPDKFAQEAAINRNLDEEYKTLK